ncbi:MAG: beta-lactamase [Pseudomonas sp.]|nr:beta-lactamase [Pseudomonas sp.]
MPHPHNLPTSTVSDSSSLFLERKSMMNFSRFTLAALLLTASAAQAAVPAQVKTQVPGYFRLNVGNFEVTALFDGYNDLSPDLLKGLSPSKIRALLARNHLYGEGVQTSFNAFLINTGKNLVLVDTGAGQCIGETAGHLSENMKAAGYTPDQVDTVLLTHLHLDHVCGLVDAQHQPIFPNAKVYASKAEADYWLAPTAMAEAPAAAREYFKIAQDSTKPYVDAGRFKTFELSPPVEGLTAHPAPGHTPGSTTYTFTSNGQSIVFIGDLIHDFAVQFEHPEVSIGFDSNSQQAIVSRDRAFTDVANSKIWAAAAHLPFPGIGHINSADKHFEWIPAQYGPYQRVEHVPLLK